jgi:hypothetical protein
MGTEQPENTRFSYAAVVATERSVRDYAYHLEPRRAGSATQAEKTVFHAVRVDALINTGGLRAYFEMDAYPIDIPDAYRRLRMPTYARILDDAAAILPDGFLGWDCAARIEWIAAHIADVYPEWWRLAQPIHHLETGYITDQIRSYITENRGAFPDLVD